MASCQILFQKRSSKRPTAPNFTRSAPICKTRQDARPDGEPSEGGPVLRKLYQEARAGGMPLPALPEPMWTLRQTHHRPAREQQLLQPPVLLRQRLQLGCVFALRRTVRGLLNHLVGGGQ